MKGPTGWAALLPMTNTWGGAQALVQPTLQPGRRPLYKVSSGVLTHPLGFPIYCKHIWSRKGCCVLEKGCLKLGKCLCSLLSIVSYKKALQNCSKNCKCEKKKPHGVWESCPNRAFCIAVCFVHTLWWLETKEKILSFNVYLCLVAQVWENTPLSVLSCCLFILNLGLCEMCV